MIVHRNLPRRPQGMMIWTPHLRSSSPHQPAKTLTQGLAEFDLHFRCGRFAQAKQLSESNYNLALRTYGPESSLLISPLLDLARTWLAFGALQKAATYIRKAISFCYQHEEITGGRHEEDPRGLATAASLSREWGHSHSAIHNLRQAIQRLREFSGEYSSEYFLWSMTLCVYELEHGGDGASLLRRAEDFFHDLRGWHHHLPPLLLAQAKMHLATLKARTGTAQQARAEIAETVKVLNECGLPNHPIRFQLLLLEGEVRLAQQDYAHATSFGQEANLVVEYLFPNELIHPWKAPAHRLIAKAAYETNRFPEAAQNARQVCKIIRDYLGMENARYASAINLLGSILIDSDINPPEGSQLKREASMIWKKLRH